MVRRNSILIFSTFFLKGRLILDLMGIPFRVIVSVMIYNACLPPNLGIGRVESYYSIQKKMDIVIHQKGDYVIIIWPRNTFMITKAAYLGFPNSLC